jgi:hypothetical protein
VVDKKGIELVTGRCAVIRFNCVKAAFNVGASKLIVMPFGRWKLSIVKVIHIIIISQPLAYYLLTG